MTAEHIALVGVSVVAAVLLAFIVWVIISSEPTPQEHNDRMRDLELYRRLEGAQQWVERWPEKSVGARYIVLAPVDGVECRVTVEPVRALTRERQQRLALHAVERGIVSMGDQPGNAALLFKNRPVVQTSPIGSTDFDTLQEFGREVQEQNLPIIVVTPAAWEKYNSLLFTPEELARLGNDEKEAK